MDCQGISLVESETEIVEDGALYRAVPPEVVAFAEAADVSLFEWLDEDIFPWLATCAREADGAVWCWEGQPAYWGDESLTRGAPLDAPTRPSRVPGLDAVDLAIGSPSMCAVTRAGAVVCTGPEDPSEVRSPARRWTVP